MESQWASWPWVSKRLMRIIYIFMTAVLATGTCQQLLSLRCWRTIGSVPEYLASGYTGVSPQMVMRRICRCWPA